MLEDLRIFLSLSTIHGLGWIPISSRLLKLFWICVVSAGFGISTYLIVKSFKGWEESPIATSVEMLPITEITFPNVTVCPPRDTFTILNYDLAMAENVDVTGNVRDKLLNSLDEAVVFAGFKDVLNDFSIFVEKNRFRNWYEGLTRISFPYWTGGSHFKVGQGKKIYKYYTYATTGEFVTPFYQDPWTDEKFEISSMYYSLFIQKPWSSDDDEKHDNTNIVFDVEQDMLSELPGSRWGGRDISYVEEDLVPFKKNLTVVRSVQEEYNVYYDKILTAPGLARIKRKRIPGMKVKWRWDKQVPITKSFTVENTNFIRMANIVQSSKDAEQVWSLVRDMRLDTKLMRESDKDLCVENMNKDSVFIGRVLTMLETKLRIVTNQESQFKRRISDEYLNIAAEIYIYLIYCPNPDYRSPGKNSWVELYRNLFSNNNQQTIILTMSRVISEVEIQKAFEYNLARQLFEKVWTVFQLKSKDIATLTMGEKEIVKNVLVKDQYQNISSCSSHSCKANLEETKELEELINHPVHIVDRGSGKLSPSAFIPFCEFGSNAELLGERIDQFDFPVCNSFHKTILNGQLCYQINIGDLKMKTSLRNEDLRIGLTLLLDYNFDRTLRPLNSLGGGQNKNTSNGIVYFIETEEALIHIGSITPIDLYGAGHYKLGGIKQVGVTDSFLGMEQKLIKCQNLETLETCNTRSYLRRVKDTCGCIPFKIRYHIAEEYLNPICTPKLIDCVKKIELEDKTCLPECSGVFITNVEDNSNNLNKKIKLDVEKLFKQYEEYEYFMDKVAFHRAFKYKANLQLVRLYIDTPTFDKITKDQSSKLEDRISTIGGNLGLLTGFSIISMVEVTYVVAKILLGLARERILETRPGSQSKIISVSPTPSWKKQ